MLDVGGMVVFVRTEVSEKKNLSYCHILKYIFTWTGLRSNPVLRDVRPATAWPVTHSYLCCYFITYSIQESRWEARRLSARQEIASLYWIPKVHYRIRKCPSPVPALSSYLYSMNIINYYAQSGNCRERWKLRTCSLECPAFTGPSIQGSLCTNTKSFVDERKLILCLLY